MATVPAKKQANREGLAASIRAGTTARYWVCLSVLVLAAAGLGAVQQALGVYLRKEAVDLKRELQHFDARKLGPRYARSPLTDRIPAMSEDMIESLGTRQYVQMFIEDRTQDEESPTRLANLFVTYYTGKPDMVPHVPDECYLAGGYDAVSKETREVRVAGVGAPDDEIPVRVLVFRMRQRNPFATTGEERAVLYFFHVNGGYATTRNGVRAMLSNPLERYAYYAKIEITFTDGQRGHATKEEAVQALGPLLERVMPVLLEDHFDLSAFSDAEESSEGMH